MSSGRGRRVIPEVGLDACIIVHGVYAYPRTIDSRARERIEMHARLLVDHYAERPVLSPESEAGSDFKLFSAITGWGKDRGRGNLADERPEEIDATTLSLREANIYELGRMRIQRTRGGWRGADAIRHLMVKSDSFAKEVFRRTRLNFGSEKGAMCYVRHFGEGDPSRESDGRVRLHVSKGEFGKAAHAFGELDPVQQVNLLYLLTREQGLKLLRSAPDGVLWFWSVRVATARVIEALVPTVMHSRGPDLLDIIYACQRGSAPDPRIANNATQGMLEGGLGGLLAVFDLAVSEENGYFRCGSGYVLAVVFGTALVDLV